MLRNFSTHTVNSQKRWDLRSSRDRYFYLLIRFLLHRRATVPLQYVSTYEDWWEPGIGQTYFLCCLHRLFSLSWVLLTAHLLAFQNSVTCAFALWSHSVCFHVTCPYILSQAIKSVCRRFWMCRTAYNPQNRRIWGLVKGVGVRMWVLCQGCSNQSSPARTLSEPAADRYHSVMLPWEDQSPKIKSEAHLIWPGGKTPLVHLTLHVHVTCVLGVWEAVRVGPSQGTRGQP